MKTQAKAIFILLFAIMGMQTITTSSASALSASASKTEYNRTRVASHTSNLTSSGTCLLCTSVWYKFNDGSARLSTAAGPYASAATKSPSKSKVNPKAAANGISLSASLSGGGLGVGFSGAGGACNAGYWEASGSTVSVSMSGTWCKISSNLTVYSPRVSVTAATLYGSAWSTFQS